MMRAAVRRTFAIALFVVTAACAEETLQGHVVGVTDGDTIVVLVEKQEHKVRLHGVDAPERKQAFGTRARQFASGMVFCEDVTVDVVDMDRYGRHVGIVHTSDNRILNHELVKAGMAWWYAEYAPHDTVLPVLQAEARDARRGLWADAAPVAPWEYRKRAAARRTAAPDAKIETRHEAKTSAGATKGATGATHVIVPTERYLRTPAGTRGDLVVIAPTGDKYHTFSCRHGRNGKRVTIESALEAGYAKCKVCGGHATRAEDEK
jgi:endonuclease YncB( thermonuclease family)